MKKALAMFAAGMIPAMMFAADFTLQTTSPWKKTGADSAAIDYDGRKAWPHLRLKTAEALKPNTLHSAKTNIFMAGGNVSTRLYLTFTLEYSDGGWTSLIKNK